MTTTAPPGQARPSDIVSHRVEDAVIEQARRRARRRHAATAVIIGLLLAAAFAMFSWRESPPIGPSSGAGEGAAAVELDARAAQLLDRYGILHVGWVAAYADGRVIWHLEGAPYGELDNLAERRLSEDGIARVRAQAIDWAGFLKDPAGALPRTAWSEPTARPYVPSTYAVCLEWVAAGFTSSRVLPVRQVPTPARNLLEGRPLARDAFMAWHDPSPPTFSPPESAWHCIDVDRAGIAALARTGTLESWGGTSRGITFTRYPDGSTDIARILPVLPHGEFDPAGG